VHNIHNVAYLLKARIVELQQLAVTRQRPINKNRGMAFSWQSLRLLQAGPVSQSVSQSVSQKTVVVQSL
jgi:hypothetical protein